MKPAFAARSPGHRGQGIGITLRRSFDRRSHRGIEAERVNCDSELALGRTALEERACYSAAAGPYNKALKLTSRGSHGGLQLNAVFYGFLFATAGFRCATLQRPWARAGAKEGRRPRVMPRLRFRAALRSNRRQSEVGAPCFNRRAGASLRSSAVDETRRVMPLARGKGRHSTTAPALHPWSTLRSMQLP